MRTRKRKTSTNPKDQIIQIATDWLHHIKQGNKEDAAAIRKKADPILQDHPEFKQPPFCAKAVYMAWDSFIMSAYPKEKKQLDELSRRWWQAVNSGDKDKASKFAYSIAKISHDLTGRYRETGSTGDPDGDQHLFQHVVRIGYKTDGDSKLGNADEYLDHVIEKIKKQEI